MAVLRRDRIGGWVRWGSPGLSIGLLLTLLAPSRVGAQPLLPGAPPTGTAPPAPFVHESWSAAAGLPVNQLTRLIQSEDGYLWFTTFDGLIRFDGHRFVVLNTASHPELPTGRLTNVRESTDGTLWVRTEAGHLLEFRSDTFRDHTPSLGGGPVLGYHVDPEWGVFVGTPHGAYHFREGSFVPLFPAALRRPQTFLVDGAGHLWVGTLDGELYRSAPDLSPPLTRVDGIAADPLYLLEEAPDGAIWVGGSRSITRIHGEEVVSYPSHGDALPTALHPPTDTHPLWIQTWGGPLAFDGVRWRSPLSPDDSRMDLPLGVPGPDGRRWTVAGPRVFRDGELLFTGPGRLEGLHFDHEGTVWLWGEGLHRLRPGVVEQWGSAAGLVDNVYAIHEDRGGGIWLGSLGGGLLRLYGGEVERFATDPASGLSNIALAIHEDREGTIWVGRWEGGVCRLVGNRCPPSQFEPLGDRLVRGIHESPDGTLWFGTDGGLHFRSPTGAWSHLSTADGLPHSDVRTFAEGPDGALWIGTYGGGVAHLRDGEIVTIGTESGLSSPVVRSLHLDQEGVLWVGTEGRGLNRITETPDGGWSVGVIRVRDGLFDEGIHQILEDDRSRLWMSSNRGIFWVSRTELMGFLDRRVSRVHSTSYTERDGLLNREMNGGVHAAGIRDRQGKLWFGGIAGVARIDPATVQRNEIPPPVSLEEILVAGDPRWPEDGVVRLARGERNFEVAFTALSFVAPENVRFRYRLEGFDPDWVEAGSRRTAYYTNVPAGEYHFQVTASNNDGVWNEEGARVRIQVAPYFLETWPARGGLLLLIGLMVAGTLRIRERNLRERSRELEAMVVERTRTVESQAGQLRALNEAKSRFFADVSHELRTPLTLTIGPLEDLQEGLRGPLPDTARRDLELALRSSHRVLELVNQILDVARLEAGEMEIRPVSGRLDSFLREMVEAFTPLAERKRIRLDIDLSHPLPELWFDPDLLEKVLANLLSNALKFTPEGGAVRLSASLDGEQVAVEVRDSGPGIPADELPDLFQRFRRGSASRARAVPGTGIGLALAREITHLHGGLLSVASEEGFGATFTLRLPLGTEHFPNGTEFLSRREPRGEGLRPPLPPIAPEPTSDEEPATPDADETESHRPLVLVADDHPEVRALLRRHLSPRCRVVEAANGADALEQARATPPDLVVSDLVMPGVDGVALTERLRDDADFAEIPILILSARADVEDRVRALERGADDYLTKPFQRAELVARVESLLRYRDRIRSRPTPPALHPEEGEVVSAESRFLARVRDLLEERLSDPEFDVEALAHTLGYSRSALYRRLAEAGTESPGELLRRFRLERGAHLLEGRAGTVGHIAYRVGFKTVSHFSRAFREHFGVTPSAWREGER